MDWMRRTIQGVVTEGKALSRMLRILGQATRWTLVLFPEMGEPR